jgi:para-nitrobenzyl esterase
MEKTKVIKTTNGNIQGYKEGGLEIFKGIPYAAPPIGALRFKSPIKPDQWEKTLITTDFSPICPQVPVAEAAQWLFGEPREENEAESLTLNIWTPSTDKKKRPVMFWIHGGNYVNGSSAQDTYDGLPLAKKGNVVVVTINYRLGSLGYLHIPGKTANAGHLDQILALRWVQENIENFGGDPSNVTIFGESAGGNAVVTLLAMPGAKGLFHKAIAQSAYSYYASFPEQGSKEFISKLKVDDADLESLQEMELGKIINTHLAMMIENMQTGKETPFVPAIDGETLKETTISALNKGFSSEIPLLIGTNKDEMKFLRPLIPNFTKVDKEGLPQRINAILSNLGKEKNTKELIEAYQKNRNNLQDILEAIQTDIGFRIFSTRIAEAQSKHQPNTYMYMFTWPSPWMDGQLGCPHAIEIAFAFGTYDKPGQDMYCGKGKDVEELSEKVMDTWIAFARSGNPNHKGIPKWVPYDDKKRSTMLLGKEIKLEEAPLEDERAAWDEIYL